MTSIQLEELLALREGAAVCAHGLRTPVQVVGHDVLPWLDRLCSNPVADLQPGGCVDAVLMDGKGKLRCDLRVIASPAFEGVVLDLPSSHREELLRVLDMFVIKEPITLVDLSERFVFLAVVGPRAEAVLQHCTLPVPGPGEATTHDAVPVITRSRLVGGPGFDLLVPAGGVRWALKRIAHGGAEPVSRDALDLVRVERGVPWFADDLASGVIPLEALLGDRVSITKGCYPGQEVVARISNLGQVARKLVRLRAPGAPRLAPGAELHGTGELAGKSAGSVTSVVHDPAADVTLALGFVRRAFWDDGTLLQAGGTELTVESLG